jgi:hypothetical protein
MTRRDAPGRAVVILVIAVRLTLSVTALRPASNVGLLIDSMAL